MNECNPSTHHPLPALAAGLLALACWLAVPVSSLAAPIGFASLNGGTTGGAGGTTVTVSTGTALQDAIKNKGGTPLTILVSGTITPSNSSGLTKIDVKDVDHLSIIGAGAGAELDGIGIKITRASNIIVQNLEIHHVAIGDKDAISIEGPASNIWIDHNELYSTYQGVDKDFYDGLLDTKNGAEYITISYNFLHDSWKTSLNGSSDGDSGRRLITYHHNRFENVNSRVPLWRFGEGHLFNNYYDRVAVTGINSRMGARLRVDSNHFENSKNVIVSCDSDDVGYWDARNNAFLNVTWELTDNCLLVAGPNVQSTTVYDPPYGYSLTPVGDVKTHVTTCAGVGKLGITNCGGGSTTPQQVAAPVFSPAPGTYSSVRSVSMSSSTGGATIRYTTGGTNPTCTTGAVYGSPVNVASITTLRAIACATGMTASAVTTGTYTISASTGGSVIQENTTGFCRVEGSISTSNAGYTGAGYANLSNSAGKGVDWSVSAPSAGTYTLTFRYENGASTVSTAGAIEVNGATVYPAASFPRTASKTTWTTVSFIVALNAGVNAIRLEAASGGEFANIDSLQVSGGAAGAACN